MHFSSSTGNSKRSRWSNWVELNRATRIRLPRRRHALIGCQMFQLRCFSVVILPCVTFFLLLISCLSLTGSGMWTRPRVSVCPREGISSQERKWTLALVNEVLFWLVDKLDWSLICISTSPAVKSPEKERVSRLLFIAGEASCLALTLRRLGISSYRSKCNDIPIRKHV